MYTTPFLFKGGFMYWFTTKQFPKEKRFEADKNVGDPYVYFRSNQILSWGHRNDQTNEIDIDVNKEVGYESKYATSGQRPIRLSRV
jgi:hypothetical protein